MHLFVLFVYLFIPPVEKVGVYRFTVVRPFFLPSLPSVPFLVKKFVKDFSTTVQARIILFGVQVDCDLLYRGIENQPSPAYSFLYLSSFFFSILRIMKFSSKISPQPFKLE